MTKTHRTKEALALDTFGVMLPGFLGLAWHARMYCMVWVREGREAWAAGCWWRPHTRDARRTHDMRITLVSPQQIAYFGGPVDCSTIAGLTMAGDARLDELLPGGVSIRRLRIPT